MGEVYLARDETLQRHVAIKFLSLDSSEAARAAVLREARAAAALEHQHICGVYEVGDGPDGRPYIVMQYAEGATLANLLAAGPLSATQSLNLCAQVADALGAAHAKGLAHRDLKPQNIVVAPSGAAKLLDFGLAKALPMKPFAADMSTNSSDTTTGVVKGTLAYMSPEQVLGQPIDGRSDLFALGAVFYECLTGQRPFAGTGFELIGNILHAQPPAPSSIRPGLTAQHDALCRRLLAKEPADRFQTAEELLTELHGFSSVVATPVQDSPASASQAPGSTARGRRWGIVGVLALVTVVIAVTGVAWAWRASRALPPPAPEAQRWYDRGVEAIRQGAYYSGERALLEAVRIAPAFPLAHARLAEAKTELDDERGAQESLLRVSALVPDESRLPEEERVRLTGIRSLVLRDVDASVAAYRQLAERLPSDSARWLDLGRALETSGHLGEATAAYRRAVDADPLSPVAHLRLASALALESDHDRAVQAFDESVRLYAAAANIEGEAEAVLRRGKAREAQGNTATARADLERSLSLANTLGSVHQQVRARLALSGVAVSEGQGAESVRLAEEAVNAALAAGLDTVAADGLVDLSGTLLYRQAADPAPPCERAIEMAERRGARRIAARARVQLAAIRQAEGRSSDALALVEAALPFLRARRYRAYELYALSVASRAREELGDFGPARTIAADVLTLAERLGDGVQTGIALGNLASLSAAAGELPDALAYRVRTESYQREHDASSLPYHIAGRAEVLIRLGRPAEAEQALEDIEAGAAKGLDTYRGRLRRVAFLRGMSSVVAQRYERAMGYLAPLAPFTTDGGAAGALGPPMLAYAGIKVPARRPVATGGPAEPSATPQPVSPVHARERQYWTAQIALARNDWPGALGEASRGLDLLGKDVNEELEWRLCAVASHAAAEAGRPEDTRRFAARARHAIESIRTRWKEDAVSYFSRPDLAELLAHIGRE